MDNERYILQKQTSRTTRPRVHEQTTRTTRSSNQQDDQPEQTPEQETPQETPLPPQDEAYQQDEQANQQDDPPQGEANRQDGTQEHPLRATEAHPGADPEAVRLFYEKARELEKEFMRNLHTNVLWEVVQGTIGKAEQYRQDFGDVISLSNSGCSQQLKTEVPDK